MASTSNVVTYMSIGGNKNSAHSACVDSPPGAPTTSPRRDGKDHSSSNAVSAYDLEGIPISSLDATGFGSQSVGAVGAVLRFAEFG